jgi:hypothetical protein
MLEISHLSTFTRLIATKCSAFALLNSQMSFLAGERNQTNVVDCKAINFMQKRSRVLCVDWEKDFFRSLHRFVGFNTRQEARIEKSKNLNNFLLVDSQNRLDIDSNKRENELKSPDSNQAD